MATKARKNSWGWTGEPLLVQFSGRAKGRQARVLVHLGKKAVPPKAWSLSFHDAEGLIRVAESAEGPCLLVTPRAVADIETDARLQSHLKVQLREAMGPLVAQLERLDVQTVEINLDMPVEYVREAVIGLEMALYRFKRVIKGEAVKFKLVILHRGKLPSAKVLSSGWALGTAVNLARHLVNLPPNWLNPVTYADFIQDLFSNLPHVRTEVWDENRLKKENMGLHLAVGSGSSTPPRLVHIRYRPKGSTKKPVAFVGKGITFDSGGLDIKPASGMRLMKKDMGGSAAVVALAYWAARSAWKQPADFYVALAENSVAGDSFRPSDVITARSGLAVEIHNTDAEGRLVLADALSVAVSAIEKPQAVVNIATLTGAIKTALGAGVAGLFSNNLRLSSALTTAATRAGDWVWPMPLVQKYRNTFNTPFADLVNATDGFGGAITAALFLERFVADVPWAHLDIYAWKDSAEGACLESGGSGQSVLGLAQWAESLS